VCGGAGGVAVVVTVNPPKVVNLGKISAHLEAAFAARQVEYYGQFGI
jgi:hypothetical protein